MRAHAYTRLCSCVSLHTRVLAPAFGRQSLLVLVVRPSGSCFHFSLNMPCVCLVPRPRPVFVSMCMHAGHDTCNMSSRILDNRRIHGMQHACSTYIYTSHVLVQCAGHMAWRTCTVCHVHMLHLCDIMPVWDVMRVCRSLMSVQECHRTCVYARHAQSVCSCGMGSHAAFPFTGHVL